MLMMTWNSSQEFIFRLNKKKKEALTGVIVSISDWKAEKNPEANY